MSKLRLVKSNGKLRHFLILIFCLTIEQCEGTQGRSLAIANFIPDFKIPTLITYQGNGTQKYEADTVGIITANGFKAETHKIETEDGYILTLHRIKAGNSNKFPVLLIHGNFQSSADWVVNSPANASFAFILSQMGYDVWLGNHRGNLYSKQHTRYKLNSHQFWDFSYHQMGLFDVPSMIDYVLEATGKPKVHYISFSLGTTAFTVGLSLRPEYSDKVAVGIMMGPSVYLNNFINGLAYYFSFSSKFVDAFINTFGAVPIIPHVVAKAIHSFLPIFCHPKVDVIGICISVMQIAFGHDGNLIRKDQIPLITSVAPSSTGLKTWNHVLQQTGSGRFAQYDYGRVKNLEIYGNKMPPLYNLTNIQAPIALFVGAYDFLAHREDAKLLASKLPNLIEYYQVPYPKFTHLDFTYGREIAAHQVYLHAIELMMNYGQ